MKRYLILIIVILITDSSNGQDRFKELADSLANSYLKNLNGSLVIGVRDHDSERIFYYGETDGKSKQSPAGNSIYELGEVSQVFTCLLFAEMATNGIVNMDEKLQDFLPVSIPAPVYQKIVCQRMEEASQLKQMGEHENVRINFTPYVCFPDPSSKPQHIILCDLATHTTGLPEYPYNLDRKKNVNSPFENYSKEDLYNFLKEFQFDKPLGYDYKYSATGIALLGHAMSVKAKKDFNTLISDRVFDKMQMSDTRVLLSEIQNKHLVQGHDKNGKIVGPWNYDIMAPAGGFHSTPLDMMKFLTANISVKKDSIAYLLDYTHNARLKLTDKKRAGMEIALGWKVNPLGVEEKRVVWQDGSTGGFSSYIGFVETNHTGVFVLSSVSKSVNNIALEVLKRLAVEKLQ